MTGRVKLAVKGRVFLEYKLRVVTGLHIGGSAQGMKIGGVDNPVIRDPLTDRPYVPGSSLKGKIRSLLEKFYGKEPNRPIGDTYIHVCEKGKEYQDCEVCVIFGVPAELDYENTPTRLLVRDLHLSEESARDLEALPLDRPYTEMKTEVSIDRITSQANPRPLERVPAGALFGPGEFVYTIYSGDGLADPREDVKRLAVVFQGMSLLEHDYLGGMGSRGSGRIKFEDIHLTLRAHNDYFAKAIEIAVVSNVEALLAKQEEIIKTVLSHLGL